MEHSKQGASLPNGAALPWSNPSFQTQQYNNINNTGNGDLRFQQQQQLLLQLQQQRLQLQQQMFAPIPPFLLPWQTMQALPFGSLQNLPMAALLPTVSQQQQHQSPPVHAPNSAVTVMPHQSLNINGNMMMQHTNPLFASAPFDRNGTHAVGAARAANQMTTTANNNLIQPSNGNHVPNPPTTTTTIEAEAGSVPGDSATMARNNSQTKAATAAPLSNKEENPPTANTTMASGGEDGSAVSAARRERSTPSLMECDDVQLLPAPGDEENSNKSQKQHTFPSENITQDMFDEWVTGDVLRGTSKEGHGFELNPAGKIYCGLCNLSFWRFCYAENHMLSLKHQAHFARKTSRATKDAAVETNADKENDSLSDSSTKHAWSATPSTDAESNSHAHKTDKKPAASKGNQESDSYNNLIDDEKEHNDSASSAETNQSTLQPEPSKSPAVACDELTSTLLEAAAAMAALNHDQQQAAVSIAGFEQFRGVVSLFSKKIGAISGSDSKDKTEAALAAKSPGKLQEHESSTQKIATEKHNTSTAVAEDVLSGSDGHGIWDLDLREFVVPDHSALDNQPQPIVPRTNNQSNCHPGAKNKKREGPANTGNHKQKQTKQI